MSIHDLSSTKPIPKLILYIGAAFLFVLFLFDGPLSLIIGLSLLAAGAYVFYKYWQDKNISKYALILYLNSGSLMSILSDSDLF